MLDGTPGLRKQIYIRSTTLLSVFLPLWIYYRRFKLTAVSSLFAGDAFYYLTVAKRSSFQSGFSFDGIHQTNGFHPLWQWLLVFCSRIHLLNFTQPADAVLRVYLLDAALLSIATGALAWVMVRRFHLGWITVPALCPGLFWLAALPIDPGNFSAWSYCNGMESALALLCFALAALIYPQAGSARWRFVLLGAVLGLGTLARLDDGFLYAAIALAVVMHEAGAAGRMRVAAELALFPALVFSYLLYNLRHVGVLLPLSGAAKAQFGFVENLKRTVQVFTPIVYGDVPRAFRPGAMINVLNEVGGRELQAVLPALVCLAFFVWTRRKPQVANQSWVRYACIGVLCKAAYTFTFVWTFEQGQWYFAVSIALANLLIALSAVWWWRQIDMPRAQRIFAQRCTPAALLLWVLLSCNSYFSTRDRKPMRGLTLPNPELNARVDALDTVGVIDYDDGLIAYALNKPAMGGIGLVLDREASRALHNGQLLDLAYRRGYRVVVADDFYGELLRDGLQRKASGEQSFVYNLQEREFTNYQLKPVDGAGSDDGFVLFRLIRINQAVATGSSVHSGQQ